MVLFVAAGLAFLLVALAIGGLASYAILTSIKARTQFSQYQTTDDAQQLYKACKQDAPQGFDCVMIPMLVSEGALKDGEFN